MFGGGCRFASESCSMIYEHKDTSGKVLKCLRKEKKVIRFKNKTIMKSFKELIVWQKSIDIAIMVYRITSTFPESEKYSLTKQLKRCAISIPSNIAEGNGRYHKKDFIRFLSIARGSLYELQTQLIIAEKLGLVIENNFQNTHSTCIEKDKMLNKLIKSLKDLST